MRKYWIWQESTCWVCTGGGVSKPQLRATSKGPDLRTPCATTPMTIVAESREAAIKKYKEGRR